MSPAEPTPAPGTPPTREAADWKEHAERLYAMAVDDGDTWDLSENDQAACNAGGDAIMALVSRAENPASLPVAAPPAVTPHAVRQLWVFVTGAVNSIGHMASKAEALKAIDEEFNSALGGPNG